MARNSSDFLGGLFDFNHDGKTEFTERLVGYKVIRDSIKNTSDSSRTGDSWDSSEEDPYAWRDTCERDYEVSVSPEDYETEEEYLEAVQEERHAWRDTCDRDYEVNVSPEDYETEEEYLEAVQEERYGWRDTCDRDYDVSVSPEDYETEEEYLEAVQEERYGWRYTCKRDYDVSVSPEDCETEEEYREAVQKERYGWRDTCEQVLDVSVFPENYETEEDYLEAVQEERYAWREDYEDDYERGVFPEDYETEEDYLEALEDAKNLQAEESSLPYIGDFLENMREEAEKNQNGRGLSHHQQRAIEVLAYDLERYGEGSIFQDEIERCRFILEKEDSVLAAKYTSWSDGFLYARAVRENFTLPVSLPEEEEKREYEMHQVVGKIAKKDILLSIRVWEWALEQFLPYAEYDEDACQNLIDDVVRYLYSFPKGFPPNLVHYMDEHPAFRQKIADGVNESVWNYVELMAAAITEKLYETAAFLFERALRQANGKWQKINQLVEDSIGYYTEEEDLALIEFFRDRLFPLVKAIPIGMVQDEIEGWEKTIADYIDETERESERYAFSRRYEWRNHVPNGREYDLDVRDYETEEEYLEALNQEKYGWREEYDPSETMGLRVEDYETEKEFCAELTARRNAAMEKERAEREAQRRAAYEARKKAALDIKAAAADTTVYTICGVEFSHSLRPYHYVTSDLTIQIGDTVVVPVGNSEKRALVVSVGRYLRRAAPYPVEQLKPILRRLPADANQPEEPQ